MSTVAESGRARAPRAGATLVLGGQPRVIVALARSLDRHGVPVVAVPLGQWDATIRSRAIRAIEPLRSPTANPADCGGELFCIIDRHGVDCLMVGNDRALNVVSALHAALSRRVRLTCPPPETVRCVLDKARALACASAVGLPVPRTHRVTNPAELAALRSQLEFPLVVKRASRGAADVAPERSRDRVHVLRSYESLRILVDECAPTSWLLQEYFGQDDVYLAMIVRRGEAVARFQCRATKTLPRDCGPSVMTVTEEVDETMAAAALALLRRLQWEGVAQFDFRRDRRSGRWVFLEINGRFWGSVAAAIKAGQDFPWQVWRQAHGLPPAPAQPYRAGRKVRWLVGDLKRLAEALQSPQTGWPERMREIGRFVADCRPTVAGMIWSWRDPMAAISELRMTLTYWALTRLRTWRQRPARRIGVGTPSEPLPPAGGLHAGD